MIERERQRDNRERETEREHIFIYRERGDKIERVRETMENETRGQGVGVRVINGWETTRDEIEKMVDVAW